MAIIMMGMQGMHHQVSFTTATFLFPVFAILYLIHSNPYDIEIENDLKFNANLYTYTLRKLALMDRVIHDFYGDELFSIYKRL